MIRSSVFRLTLLALLLCVQPVFADTPNVSALEIRGSSDPSLVKHVTVKVGEPLNPETVRSSVILLAATDLFDEVAVEHETEADGTLRLVFKVLETPRLRDLIFLTRVGETGPESPLDSKLEKALSRVSGLREGEAFREKSLADASTRMTDWLRSNGYQKAMVEIEPILDQYPKDESALGFARDVRVRVLQANQETLVSSRIEGWPKGVPLPAPRGDRGDPLTEETLDTWTQELLSILWKSTHYRAQVKHDSVQGDLVFFVVPGPPFDLKLDLLGEKERSKVRSRFEEEGLSQDAIEETISAIESDYVKRGHRDIEVDFQDVRVGERATLDFVVRPGPLWRVAGVEYLVDGVASPKEGMDLKTGVPWIDADIEAEKTRLRADLLERGHASAAVSLEESGEPLSAKVIFKITPGPSTTIASVLIEGSPAPADRSSGATSELVTREGSPFRNADAARDRTTLLDALREDGYLDARVEVATDFSEDRTKVAVVFRVTSGPRVRVGRVVVVGLKDTKETVVRRESRLKEGDFLSYRKLLDTQAGLSATGLFSNVQIRELAAEGERRHLIIEVTEGARTSIVPSLGYAETEGPRASVELTKLNISGRGRTASAFLRGSIRGSSRAVLSLTEPYAFGRRQSVNVQLYFDDDRSRDAFDLRRQGFQTQTVFPLLNGSLLARYTFQNTTTSNVSRDCAEVNRDLCDGRVSGPSLGFVHDTRNDAIDPRRGSLYSVDTLLSVRALGGDSFIKSTAFAARFDEIRAGTVLAASARFGVARAFGPTADLPLPERFFAGGPTLMRAFRIDGVGPGRFNSDGLFIPAGGNALLAGALELRIDLTRAFGFQVFAEAGNVFSRVSSLRLSLRELREVAGVGLRYRSPFGPVRLDLGFKLDKRLDEKRYQLHLGVGYAF